MTKQIAAALVKAQRDFAPALKTSTNPHFRSRYADLSAVVEAVIDALNANGIFLMQATHECDSGVIVETVFIHESGEQITAGKLHVPATKADAQGYGSALTYARRYALMAACGIAPEDDDGNAAAKASAKKGPVAESFRSSPTMGILESLPVDEQTYLRDLAEEVKTLTATDARERILSENLEVEQKTALWSLLDSKTRAAIKKADEAAKEPA